MLADHDRAALRSRRGRSSRPEGVHQLGHPLESHEVRTRAAPRGVELGGGDRSFPVDESVRINIVATAFEDATLGTSIGVSLFPVPLP